MSKGNVHENTNYVVVVGTNKDGLLTYFVVNKQTAVVEEEQRQLSQAILYAEHTNTFLVNELWKWVAVQGQSNKEALDKETATLELVDDDQVVIQHALELAEADDDTEL